ncbi:tetratricopeptide repeat protein [Dactylosporangium sp. NPDC000244]|uniref:tetratricopeptide repeat protein n=1 Tax=Dactylosporangium sp. NPDC000244 TaxID=3154365 RepID=UPI003330075D
MRVAGSCPRRSATSVEQGTLALALHRDIGSGPSQAYALASLCVSNAHLGRHDAAIEAGRRAAALTGDASEATATVLNSLGEAYRPAGRHRDAVREHRSALDVARTIDLTEVAAARQAEVGRLEKERDDEAARARQWSARRGMLADQADKLSGVAPGERPLGDIDPDDERVRQDVARLAGRLDGVDSAHQSAMSSRSQRADALRNWALQDRFARLADDEHGMAVRQMRDLLRGDQLVDRVAPRAVELALDLATREQAITQQLTQVETHKRNVVARLGDLVAEAIADLSRASTLSELPDGIGPWAGQPFLLVGPRTRPTPEQVQVRIGELVDQMVAAGKVDVDPVELLWRATSAAVVDGFRASILKPAPDQPPGRTPVEHIHKWSGGENLTASLVLFCVLAKLRTENRTGARAGAAGGVVPLDNPLGKANYLPFLELQRKVAAANGVQLLFWTGIGDLAAVGAFPRITAMRKKPAAGRPGVAYVVADDEASRNATQVNVVERVSSARAEPLA